MSEHESPILLSDAPVGLTGDLIWQGSDIGLDIEMISSTILRSEEPLVFAVHGPWGSGKTSFLKMVEEKLRQEEAQTVYISWYTASNYQTIGDVSMTLTLRILRTLREGAEALPAEKLYDSLLKPLQKPEQSVTGAYGFLEELAGRVAVLADLGVVIENFLNGGMGSGKSKLVLMVDDLDRCTLEFIGDILEAIQRLNAVKNLFIILAVDRTRLQNALEKRFEDVRVERGAQWAGEKYIQHAIELPPLEGEELEEFICQSLAPNTRGLDSQVLEGDPALKTILNATEYFVVALQNKIPRTIKACINLIRPALVKEMSKRPSLSEDERRKIIKRRLIEYLFRDFYTNWLVKAESSEDSPEAKFFMELEDLCRTYFSEKNRPSETKNRLPDTHAVFAFSVERKKAANLLDGRDLDVPEELARLLAISPPFFPYEKPLSDRVDIVEQVLELYNSCEEAGKTKDEKAFRSAAMEVYELVRDNRSATGDVAWLLGNLALIAEKLRQYDLAEHLCELALDINPNHVNNKLIFASFIIDNQPKLYGKAMSLLQAVTIKHPKHDRIGRAYRLLLQLKSKLGEPVDREIEELTFVAEQTPRIEEKKRILRHLIVYGHEQRALDLFFRLSNLESMAIEEIVGIQINVAYLLSAFCKEVEYDLVAMDLYRQIIEAPGLTSPRTLSIVKYSYAHLLQRYDYDLEASRLFYESYVHRPDSNTIKQWYPQFLIKIGAEDAAQRVVEGKPLEDMPVAATGKDLPESFSGMDIPSGLCKHT